MFDLDKKFIADMRTQGTTVITMQMEHALGSFNFMLQEGRQVAVCVMPPKSKPWSK
jgi:uncharacterized protein